jgi:pyruvate/2-oxoglutarate dehydrogenase complex dihydrolipoamide acyltransferase (E2) component
MAVPLFTPRINNNDDTVRLTHVFVQVGAGFRRGDAIADIETDKATFTIEAEQDGYLLAVLPSPGDTISVGSILAWLGADPAEPVPTVEAKSNRSSSNGSDVSLKAAILLSQYGLDALQIPHEGERLTAADVSRYVQAKGLKTPSGPVSNRRQSQPPPSEGQRVSLTPGQRGMLKTVEWQKQEASPAYLEISYEPQRWDAYALEFQKSNRLLMNPLLSLLAWKLAQLAKLHPEINATLHDGDRYVYDHVNPGFTVQVGGDLYLIVQREAENLSQASFVEKLGDLQRSAMKKSLRPEQTSGATIGFSSMARWLVTRHMPILIPHTSLMIAHTASGSQAATLGATYDHRVLSGGDVVRVLQELAEPEGNP